MQTLAIVSKALAPYRVRLYCEVAENLALIGWRVVLIVGTYGSHDHPWQDAGQTSSTIEIIKAGSGVSTSIGRKFLERIGKLFTRSDIELPTAGLLLELNRVSPDCVWTHEYSPFCLTATLWAKAKGLPCILSTDLGANPAPHACTPLQLSMHRRLAPLYSGVIAQTKEATRRWPESDHPISFAPHAIDSDEYVPSIESAGGKFRFLFAAGVRKEKGIHQLVSASRILAGEGLDFELRVIGTGPAKAWLDEQKDPWLQIGGFIEGEALRKEYQSAHAYVLPTEGDTWGVTIHEAAACGLPLIVGKTAGALECFLQEGVSGFAIDHNDIDSLAAKMRVLISDPSTATKMGREARKLAVVQDVKILGKKTAEFVLSLVPSRDTPVTLQQPDDRSPSTTDFANIDIQTYPHPRIAAVFATMNRCDVATECLHRLARQTVLPEKLFITDNASTDTTIQKLEEASSQSPLPVELIHSTENLGNAGGIKLAIDRAFEQGFTAIWILDDDSWPEPDAFANLASPNGPEEGIRSSLVLAPDNAEVSWPCEIMKNDGTWEDLTDWDQVSQDSWFRVRRSWLGSLIPKDIYESAGPLIPELFLRGEDEEYPRTLEAAGHQFWVNTKSVLRHPVAGPFLKLSWGRHKLSLEQNLSGDKLYYRIRNMIWIKHRDSGFLAASIMTIGYLTLIVKWFRPLGANLKILFEAATDAAMNRLGRR